MFRYNLLAVFLCILCFCTCEPKPTESPKQATSKDSAFLLHHESIGEGLPIIVIHGGPGLGYAYMLDHLRELGNTHQVIFYDQTNSGLSPLDIDTSHNRLAAFIDDIDRVREAYNLEKVALLAHSWGGILAMKYALKYPERVSHLVLMNSVSSSTEVNEKANTRLANSVSADDIQARTAILTSEAFQRRVPKAVEDLMLLGFAYQFAESRKIDELKLQLPDDFGEKSAHLGGLYQDLTNYNFTASLSEIEQPTLLLFGLKDVLAPFVINEMRDAFKDASVTGIKDAGHFPFIEKREETIEAIATFVK